MLDKSATYHKSPKGAEAIATRHGELTPRQRSMLILVNGRRVAPLVLGVTTFSLIIAGLIVYTVFLVREMGITEQQDSFLNSVTHELKTPIASIRLYLETLQAREIGDAQRKEFYRIMLEDSDRLLGTIEQILRTGRIGVSSRKLNLSEIDVGGVVQECLARLRTLHGVGPKELAYEPGPPVKIRADMERDFFMDPEESKAYGLIDQVLSQRSTPPTPVNRG